jgi:hypothetical protein
VLQNCVGGDPIDSGIGTLANLLALKRRQRSIVRPVPLPGELLCALDRTFGLRRRQADPDLACRRLWRWSRTTAWHRVKEIMATAGITGTPAERLSVQRAATPRSTPARPRLTSHDPIYGDVAGPEERAFAARMWRTRTWRSPQGLHSLINKAHAAPPSETGPSSEFKHRQSHRAVTRPDGSHGGPQFSPRPLSARNQRTTSAKTSPEA